MKIPNRCFNEELKDFTLFKMMIKYPSYLFLWCVVGRQHGDNVVPLVGQHDREIMK